MGWTPNAQGGWGGSASVWEKKVAAGGGGGAQVTFTSTASALAGRNDSGNTSTNPRMSFTSASIGTAQAGRIVRFCSWVSILDASQTITATCDTGDGSGAVAMTADKLYTSAASGSAKQLYIFSRDISSDSTHTTATFALNMTGTYVFGEGICSVGYTLNSTNVAAVTTYGAASGGSGTNSKTVTPTIGTNGLAIAVAWEGSTTDGSYSGATLASRNTAGAVTDSLIIGTSATSGGTITWSDSFNGSYLGAGVY